MARQGYRVWATRLVGGIVLVAIACVSIRLLWQRFANESAAKVMPSVVYEPESTPKVSEGRPLHALDPLLDLAKEALQNHVEKHQDYTAILLKRENVGGRVLPESKMAVKLKYGPKSGAEARPRTVSVYLKTLEPKSQAGREVIWVQGKNDNKLTAHEAGLLGMITVNLMPESRLAMAGNRYPITEIGIEKLLCKLIEKGERDRMLGPATIRTVENVEVGGRPCRLLEIIHEFPTAFVDGRTVEFEFFLAQIYIDLDRLLPLKYASFSWPKSADGTPELLEEYTYQDVLTNVGLLESDFDPKNPKYGF